MVLAPSGLESFLASRQLVSCPSNRGNHRGSALYGRFDSAIDQRTQSQRLAGSDGTASATLERGLYEAWSGENLRRRGRSGGRSGHNCRGTLHERGNCAFSDRMATSLPRITDNLGRHEGGRANVFQTSNSAVRLATNEGRPRSKIRGVHRELPRAGSSGVIYLLTCQSNANRTRPVLPR